MRTFYFVIDFAAEAGVPIHYAVGFGVDGAVSDFGRECATQGGYGRAFAKSGEAMRLVGLNFASGFVAESQNKRVRTNPKQR